LPELRKDPITGRWVIIATDLARRPSEFVRVPVVAKSKTCQFCAGHETETPPEILSYRGPDDRWNLRVVPNKFPALRVEGILERDGEGLYDKMSGIGAHEVIIESPEHKVSLAQLPEKRVEDLFWAVRDRILDLKRDTRLRYVLLFKNHGEAAGASLEHSHSQLIALPVVPAQVQEEIDGGLRYYQFKERCVYCDIVRQELASAARVILETEEILVLAPYAARFPFETWLVPRAPLAFRERPPQSDSSLGVGHALDHPQNRASAGISVVQFPDPHGAGARRTARSLSLASGDHSAFDESGGIRMGRRILYQSHAA